MSSEVDQYFAQARSSPFRPESQLDPNMVAHELIGIGSGNVQPAGWYDQHSYSSFVGQTNIIFDPRLQQLPNITATTTKTPYGWSPVYGYLWTAYYKVNSGTAPSTVMTYINYSNDPWDSPFNSYDGVVYVHGFPAGASDITFYLESAVFQPSNRPVLPWLMGGLRIGSLTTNTLTNVTGITAQLQLLRDSTQTTDGTVVASSTLVDFKAMTSAVQQQPLAVGWLQGAGAIADYRAHAWSIRLVVNVTTAGSGGTVFVDFGEPQLHFNYQPDLLPYTPVVGLWVPDQVIATSPGSINTNGLQQFLYTDFQTNPRVQIGLDASDRGFFALGPGGTGSTPADVRFIRTGTSQVTLDNGNGAGASLALTPSSSQTLAAATAILANASFVMVTSAGAVTLTSAPTIADGVDGQLLRILNVGANNITLQDQGTLANSNLRLTAASITLTPRDSVELVYSATVGDWVQAGNVVAVL